MYFIYNIDGCRPIIFTLGGDAKFEASFVLATLASDSQGFSYSQANNIQQQAVHKTVHEYVYLMYDIHK